MTVNGSNSESFKRMVILAFAVLYIVWGSTYLAIKLAIDTMPPYMMASLRFIIAGLILYMFIPPAERRSATLKHWQSAGLIGFLLLAVGNGGVVTASKTIPTGVVSLIVAMTPMLIALFEHFPSFNLGKRQLAGFAMGTLGIFLLVGPQTLAANGTAFWTGLLALLASTSAWSLGSIFSRSIEKPKSTLLFIAMQMICGGAALALFSMLCGEYRAFNLAGVSAVSAISLLYLILFGSIMGYGAYIWLLQNVSPTRVSTYAYVNPIIAVLLGCLLAGEVLHPHTMYAAVFILAAVWLINSKPTGQPALINKQ